MSNTIKEDITAIVSRMPRYGKLIYILYRDPSISNRQKVILSAGLAYAISPVDLIPGFIPVVGQLDDIIAVLFALVKVLKEIPPEDKEAYMSELELTMEEIEGDLAASQKAACYFMGKAAQYTGKGVEFAGKTAVKLAGKGILLAGSGMSALLKKSFSKE